jgi:nucleoside-diphosphate-sugar epimerase
MGARVLVTGGTGFVGRRLCAALRAQSFEVWAPRRQELDLVRRAAPRVEKVFHLAARTFVPDSWNEPAEFYRVNVQGTVDLLEYCRATAIPIVYVSGYCYGVADQLPIPETAPLRPNNPYAFSKVAAEAACRFFSEKFRVPVTILRPFNVYGPGQRRQFLIPQLIAQALDRAEPELIINDPRPRRDFVHVDDLVAALCMVPVTAEVHVYNVGSGRSHAVGEIAQMIQQAAETTKPILARGGPRAEEIPDAVADISALRALGWRPRIELASGLRQLIAESRATSNAVV